LVTVTNGRGVLALVMALVAGVAVGATGQRFLGFGNVLRAVGIPSPWVERTSEPAQGHTVPEDIAAEHRGRLALFILAGQSNMVGLAPVPEGEVGRTDPRVYAFGNDYRWRVAAEPLDDAAGQVDLVSEDRDAGFGPSLAFAHGLLELNPDGVVGLIPCAKSASALSEWARDLSDQTLYGSCLKRARAASPMGRIAGVLFFQGEADALDPAQDSRRVLHSEGWADLFGQFVEDIRRDFGDPRLPVVFAQIGTTTAREAFIHWERVREVQASVRIPRVAMITTDDLPLFDGLHYTAGAYRAIGERFAEAYWSLVEAEGL
jgi:hypothetical protein